MKLYDLAVFMKGFTTMIICRVIPHRFLVILIASALVFILLTTPSRYTIRSDNVAATNDNVALARDDGPQEALEEVAVRRHAEGGEASVDGGEDRRVRDGGEDMRVREGAEDVRVRDGAGSVCAPKYRVSFVKVHKVGSGAVHNVLVALALRHNLSVALPICGGQLDNYQMFPQRPLPEYILNPRHRRQFHMFLDHAVFDRASQGGYMGAGTFFFTQLRHPFSQTESALQHFGGVKHLGLKGHHPLTEYLSRPDPPPFMLHAHPCYPTSLAAPVTRNFQAFTLGFANAVDNNVTEFLPFLRGLDSELDFVGLLEYSDESSLLLKRKMCWDMRDVLRIHTHRTKRAPSRHDHNVTVTAMKGEERHREWSTLDYLLYEHFKDKLLRELSAQEDGFYEELAVYRALNEQLSGLCDRMCGLFAGLTDLTTIRRLLWEGEDIPAAQPFHGAFRITYWDCLALMSKELIMKKVLKVHLYPEACDWGGGGEGGGGGGGGGNGGGGGGRSGGGSGRTPLDYGLAEEDCDFDNHVYPGYHIEHFRQKFSNEKVCRGNYY